MTKNTQSRFATPDVRRRSLAKGLAASALAAPWLSFASKSASAAEPLVVVTWGGAYQAAMETAVAQTFTEATRIPVRLVSGPDLAKVKAQVRTRNVEWDIFDGTGPMITSGESEGLWEPLDIGAVDTKDLVAPLRKSSAPFIFSVGGIGYVPGRAKENVPKTFAQFWDTKKFAGRRGLRSRASEMLELALLADGVEPSKVYPMDVERAFASLNKIKPSITKWIDSTPQTVSLLSSNEIDFNYVYAARVLAAKKANVDIGVTLDQTLVVSEYYATLKGSKRKDEAMQFIAHALKPEIQAKFANLNGHAPVLKSSQALLTPDVLALQPNWKNPNNLLVDDTWWGENLTAVDRRFKEWLAA